ncbi:MAG: insulinase family protein, partial [Bacteroidales bacterium]|nr:insulinase family protein [Bacteroidales bacterium]
MKKFLLSLLVALLTIPAMAQMGPLPIDPKVRKGTLPNGLTYYIRHNVEPRGQAEFFISQRVGSIQEEENQRGLAHFLEHMAFNGTRHFPDKTLFTFLEGIGVRFGYNLNAYTSIEETVYNVSAVPVSRGTGVIDSVLMILWDWADGLALTDKDIEEERGVIREEWRTGQGAVMRIYEKILPEMFPNNLYGQRLPIGTIDVINNFTPQELRDYYEKWYRPDHQAIIVVGDIDVDYVENKIKELFSQIETPATPSPIVVIPVEPNEEPLIAIGTDPEMPNTQIVVSFKFDPLPKEMKLSQQGLLTDYFLGLVTSMLNTRLTEITQKANAPFLVAQSTVGGYMMGISKSMNAFSVYAVSREGGMAEAFRAAMNEVARLDQHGFTYGELERAKAAHLSNLERRFNERETTRNVLFARQYSNNFLDDEPIPGIEYEFQMISQISAMLPTEHLLPQLNMLVQQLVSDENVAIFGLATEKEGLVYPTREELLSIFTTAMETPQEPYEDDALDEPLITQMPTPGRVTSTRNVDLFEAKEFTLSNGIKVMVKPTDFKSDEIRFVGTSLGGNSLFNDSDVATFRVLDDIATIGGVGNFSRTNLAKALAGKQVSVGASVSDDYESIRGNGSPRDLETIMQLIYLYATAPRFDQEAFDAWFAQQQALLQNLALNPMVAFQDTLYTRLYGDQPRAIPWVFKPEDMEKIDYKKAIELYNDRFKDMSDFTFTFVGNIEEETFIPLMEQYIASLPNLNRKESHKDNNVRPLIGIRQAHFNREMQTVKTSIVKAYTGDADYTPENVLRFQMLNQILDLIFTEEIREKEGGTYGVGVRITLERYPIGNFTTLIMFDTDPELAENLLSIVYRELEKLAT